MEIPVIIDWEYDGKTGICRDVFGYPGYRPENDDDLEGLFFWYTEGNGACDCNRSRMIGLAEPLPCGDTIKFKKITALGITKEDV